MFRGLNTLTVKKKFPCTWWEFPASQLVEHQKRQASSLQLLVRCLWPDISDISHLLPSYSWTNPVLWCFLWMSCFPLPTSILVDLCELWSCSAEDMLECIRVTVMRVKVIAVRLMEFYIVKGSEILLVDCQQWDSSSMEMHHKIILAYILKIKSWNPVTRKDWLFVLVQVKIQEIWCLLQKKKKDVSSCNSNVTYFFLTICFIGFIVVLKIH